MQGIEFIVVDCCDKLLISNGLGFAIRRSAVQIRSVAPLLAAGAMRQRSWLKIKIQRLDFLPSI